jgi:hypothetical protein
MENVTKTTRASKRGTAIFCPDCNNYIIVDRFNWSMALCKNCNKKFPKTQFLLDPEIPKIARLARRGILTSLTSMAFEQYLNQTPKPFVIEMTKKKLNKLPDYSIYKFVKGAEDCFLKFYFVTAGRKQIHMACAETVYYYEEKSEKKELRKQKLQQIYKNTNSNWTTVKK